MGQRFTRDDRLRKRSQYNNLHRRGRRIHGTYYLAVVAPNPDCRRRLGITVSRRVGNAVIRNRVKRRVREYFRLNRDLLGKCYDINIIAKTPAARSSMRQSRKDLKRIFEKSNR